MENPVDRISSLPESIICHILSFLPTKYVVATSFLSKSWRHHWTKVTDFDFDNELWSTNGEEGSPPSDGLDVDDYDDDDVPEMSFVDFVYRVLLNQSPEVSTNRFRLKLLNFKFRSIYLYTWINTAIARYVRVLELDFWFDLDADDGYADYKFQLPGAIYTCGTLEVLELKGWPIRVKVGNVVCLPKLTRLNLNNVRYESDESVSNLISGCPNLESLMIIRLHNDNMVVCEISSPALKQLDYSHEDCRSHCECNDGVHFKLVIDTPALERILIHDHVVEEIISVQALTCLNKVSIDVHSTPREMTLAFVQACSRVDCLLLSSRMTATLVSAATNKLLASFKRLTKLSLQIDCCDQLSDLIGLIDSCTSLELLGIWNHGKHPQTLGDCSRVPSTVPKCLSSSVTRFFYLGFEALEDEMAMLKFILNHSLVMKSFEIRTPIDWEPYTIEEFKEIFLSAAVSPTCKISIS